MLEILLLHEKAETIKRKVSLLFQRHYCIDQVQIDCAGALPAFPKNTFGSLLHVSFEHEDVLVIELAGAGQLRATNAVLCRINLYVFTLFLWQGLSTGLAHR